MNKIVLAIVIVIIVGAIVYLERVTKSPDTASNNTNSHSVISSNSQAASDKSKKYELAKELVAPDGYINTDTITLQSQVGHSVVLLDFWTYSCINCQRTFPYLNAWYDKYHDQGLEIIGVHTPEFEFEKKYENVVAAVKKFNIKYPVVQDNEYQTWSAYGNRYWPHEYLIDIDGYIVHDQIGEGGYEETEKAIQSALKERMSALGTSASSLDTSMVHPPVTEEPEAGSPEVYFGSARNSYLGNGTPGHNGLQTFKAPTDINANILYLSGTWDIEPESARTTAGGEKIFFRYTARDVYFVASALNATRIHVLRDGKQLGAYVGADIANQGSDSIGTIHEERLYRLIHDTGDPAEHTLEITVDGADLQAYTFTFG